jgi:ElaB/YqjD/DUF883 family membrane-anchored ribosome-binding protein
MVAAVLQAPDKLPVPPDPPKMVSELPESLTTVQPVTVTEIRPRRIIRRTTSKSAVSEILVPVDPAIVGAAEESAIGELSAGGDSTPQTQQDAKELIATSEHRLNNYSPAARQQQEQLRKVRYFLKQARQALSSGDAEGARTLATKAKLLLDDLAK